MALRLVYLAFSRLMQWAVLLSRRRVDVLCACIRDNQIYQPKRSRSDRLAAA